MPLLLDSDYVYLAEAGFDVIEDEESRFLIFRDFPLPADLYIAAGVPQQAADVLYVVPPNYNTAGGDMFWVRQALERTDGKAIPNVAGPGQDSRSHDEVEYRRWSRHWNNREWRPKVDNIRKVVDRIRWAFEYPDPLPR